MAGNYKAVIVDTMSLKEIMELLKKDYPFFSHKIEESPKAYRKMVKNLPNRVENYFFKPLEYKSSRGFNLVLQYFKRSIEDYKKDPLGLIYYFWFVKRHGTYAIQYSLLHKTYYHYTIFTPHFFDRYRERFLADKTILTKDVINTFFRRNYRFGASGLPSNKYPNGYWMLCKDGLCLCNRLGGLTIEVKTFVTWEMSFSDQHKTIFEDIQRTKEIGWNTDFESLLPNQIFDEFNIEEE